MDRPQTHTPSNDNTTHRYELSYPAGALPSLSVPGREQQPAPTNKRLGGGAGRILSLSQSMGACGVLQLVGSMVLSHLPVLRGMAESSVSIHPHCLFNSYWLLMLYFCWLRASPENVILSALQGNSERRQSEKGRWKDQGEVQASQAQVYEKSLHIGCWELADKLSLMPRFYAYIVFRCVGA